MHERDNQAVVKAINRNLNSRPLLKPIDKTWSILNTSILDEVLFIKRTKRGILIDDFGCTFGLTAITYNLKIEKSKLSKEFEHILKTFNVSYNPKYYSLYVNVPIRDSFSGISRLEQATIHIKDLIHYRLKK